MRCIFPIDKDISLSDYNEERDRHYQFFEAFSGKGHFNILCPKCGDGVLRQTEHLNGCAERPERQMLCLKCNKTSYKLL